MIEPLWRISIEVLFYGLNFETCCFFIESDNN